VIKYTNTTVTTDGISRVIPKIRFGNEHVLVKIWSKSSDEMDWEAKARKMMKEEKTILDLLKGTGEEEEIKKKARLQQRKPLSRS
jgi:primosomal protein N''